jgi:hypothetical protein
VSYRYIHKDGRKGEGSTSWNAIKSALGEDEARALPEFSDPQWVFNKTEDSYKEGDLEGVNGEFLGKLYVLDE